MHYYYVEVYTVNYDMENLNKYMVLANSESELKDMVKYKLGDTFLRFKLIEWCTAKHVNLILENKDVELFGVTYNDVHKLENRINWLKLEKQKLWAYLVITIFMIVFATIAISSVSNERDKLQKQYDKQSESLKLMSDSYQKLYDKYVRD